MHNYSPRAKGLLLAATLAPLVFAAIAAIGLGASVFTFVDTAHSIDTTREGDGLSDASFIGLAHLAQLGVVMLPLAALWVTALMITYSIDAGRNPRLTQGRQVTWILAIVLGNLAGMLAYWLRHVGDRATQRLAQ
jgi:hypothetical protein